MNARNTQIRPFTFHSFYRPQNTQHFIIPRAINFKSWNFAMKIWVSYINCLFTWIHSLIISMRQAKPRWHESFIWSKCSFSMMNIFFIRKSRTTSANTWKCKSQTHPLHISYIQWKWDWATWRREKEKNPKWKLQMTESCVKKENLFIILFARFRRFG